MQFHKKLLSLAVCAATAGVVLPAYGQDEAAESEDLIEEVVVRGIRVSIENAQQRKRFADTVKDVITATDIGALPDKSVTEALQRVPGVTIERFASSDDPKHYADEGTGVLVRGLDRVRSEVNGRDAFSANPYGGLNYEDFPAELLSAVEVVKNQTADLISGGIAGTVNLISRKPFDSEEQMISFNAKVNYGDFREEATPSFSALFSDTWETEAGKFGFLLAGSFSEYQTRGDGIGLGNFHSRGIDDTPPASWDHWGGMVSEPGKVAGWWDSPCMDWNGNNAWTWFPECSGPTANLITEDEAHQSPYDGPGLEGQPEGTTWYAPAQYHISTAQNDRERTGITTSLQWANTDETIVATLEHINSEATLEWDERRISQAAQGFKSWMGRSHNWEGDPENGHPLTIDDEGFLTSGIGLGVEPEVPLMYITRWNYQENTVEDTSFNLALTPNDRLSIELDYQHIESEQLVHNYSLSARTAGSVVNQLLPFYLDLRSDLPTIEYLNDDLDLYGWIEEGVHPAVFMGSGMQQEELNTAESDSFKVDATYEFDGVFSAIKAGAYYSDKELVVRNTEYSAWQPISTPWVAEQRVESASALRPDLYDQIDLSDYYHGDVLQGDVQSFLFPDLDLVKNYANTLRNACDEGWSTQGDEAGNAADGSGGCALPYSDMEGRIDGAFAAHDISKAKEERAEFYLRGDFDFDSVGIPLKGNLGLRYVSYQLESTGYLVLPDSASRGSAQTAEYLEDEYKSIYDLANGESMQSTVEGTDYDTLLPSLNLSYGLTEDIVIRFGASKGLYFPSLVDTRNRAIVELTVDPYLQDESLPQDSETNPVLGIDSVALNADASNPYLEPEESINLDLTTEWYFAPAGSLTVGVFHKELDNIIRSRQFDMNIEHAGTLHAVSAYGPANTGSGNIRGVEFSYSQFYDFLPGVLSGLGLQFNYTYIDQEGLEDPTSAPPQSSRFDAGGTPEDAATVDERNTFRVFSGLPLQGYSDENLNIVGMYEYEDISFRLAYTWRSEYLLTTRESEDFAPVYTEDSGMMDASLYYTINDNIKVGIEGSNLLGEETKTQYQFNQQGDRTQALSFTTDRRYALSVRATF
ncbi:TonB-dependent receptor [Gilvimarinus agarilyticus]|uniref:TonB-dependent receptor n=1 Tax=unclassified Gilvimarinus TaxID=2642066 RepID=UPI001C088056|nr:MULTISPECIES: TonB-dependent receptor [unclassified Gilvimarinus]MBU2884664.1 TonB-dependent receptor [Gilvimarinus agarilyticus]MDO6569771.1 TonB-dependent receptor [Gilvimarinus sp. 2_MG-2023]MDO6747415.1 TonB-dependent receptor [Gilvimarinus sp. 1_MG-2023]